MSRVFCLVVDVEGILSSCGCRGYALYLWILRALCLVADVDGILSSSGCPGYFV